MNLAAIRHEATQEYCFCLEPGKFLFRLQTGKDDLCRVTLHSRDKYLPLEVKDTRRAVPMKRVACDGLRDYYEAEMEFHVVCLRYCFELEDCSGQRLFFGNGGFTQEPSGCLTAPKPCGKRSDSASPTGQPTRWCTRFSPLVLQTTSR